MRQLLVLVLVGVVGALEKNLKAEALKPEGQVLV